MEGKLTKSDAIIYGSLFLLAFLVVFKSPLNPFNPFVLKAPDVDTSVFLTIAQGITKGQVPFRDFFDNKGPLTYLFSAPGMYFGGLAGVWITELFFMCISVLFAYKTALFFGKPYFAFWGVVCSFTVFQFFFYEVAGTEEYSLPFMMVSLYIFIKYFFTQKEPPMYELITLGVCFAVTIYLRTNMFPLWLGFCVIIVIESLRKQKYLSLLRYTLFFSAGILIVSIPVFLYLYLNNAFYDYINQNFIAGTSRAFTGFSITYFVASFFVIIGKNYCFVPFIIYYVWIVKNPKEGNVYLSLGLLLAYLLTVLFLAVSRSSFNHYNMVLTPFLVPAFTFCVKYVFVFFKDHKYKKTALFFLFFIVFGYCLSFWFYSVIREIYGWKDSSRNNLIATGKTIDQNTDMDDTIISLGLNSSIYLFTERQSASRYIYQTSGADYDPNAQEEFLRDMRENKPKIIVIRSQEGHYDYLPEWFSPVYDMIANEYRQLSSENGYFLFIRR